MKKKNLPLTQDQKDRGVIFSSKLVSKLGSGMDLYEKTHEVFENDKNKEQIIENLKDDSFFDNGPYAYNLIRY